jgi:N-acetylglucosamine transport system substrate-binding protein
MAYRMRTMMTRLIAILTAGLVLAALTGCARKDRSVRASGKEIEVSVFLGGYGLDFFQDVARTYEKAHPGVKVNLWGDPRNIEKLRPRFLAGDPPDAFWAFLPIWRLADGGALYDLDKGLDTKAYGQDITWRESFIPDAMATTLVHGKTYFVPTDLSVYVMWYNVGMFRQHGWQVPQTWDEFFALCEKIKAAGIAPIAFQGRYPDYALSTLLNLFQRKVGSRPLFALINLEPGAWEHPELVASARSLREMMVKGYFEPGCMGMTHTEAQMEFVNGRTAMVPCGTWLKAEMANSTPKDFEMSCFPYPAATGGKGDPSVAEISLGYWCVPSQAANINGGVDFLKWLTSLDNANKFCKEKDTLFAVKGADRYVAKELAPAVAVIKHAKYTWAPMMSSWYPEFSKRIGDGLASLLTGNITPEEFCQRLEAHAERVRRDKRTPKYRVEPPVGAD